MFLNSKKNKTNISRIINSKFATLSQKSKVIFHGGEIPLLNPKDNKRFRSGLVALTEEVIVFKLYTMLKVFYKICNIRIPERVKYDPSPFMKFGTFNKEQIFLQELGIEREFSSEFLKLNLKLNKELKMEDFKDSKFSEDEIKRNLKIINAEIQN